MLSEDVLSATIYLVEQTLNARRLTAVTERPEDLTAFTTDHFLLKRENASAPFMPSSERYNNLRKSYKTAQTFVNMEYMDSRISCSRVSQIEGVKSECTKTE